ncbi:MAG: 16S rRNA (cytidine(1402)-2'-O)-methyltransferase [Chlamydiae bacterium]|nr:16S rRNA (cytidine(1402)-2'-O)-methyltransferase [Chlamydiota bacterium]MBI3266212.1 16S rRNA (cytidine(1402)-2'-O)-methyltransferase [Chlamydiota bacterium]
MSGTLYVVSTPIGNLEDITLRALRILKEVTLIACEDTRQTSKLLQRYDIHKPLVSCHDFNEKSRSLDLIERLRQGQDIALVSDAGTPGISDPGFKVIALAIEHQIPVFAIPGPAAFLTALTISGLPLHRFAFEGFLPERKMARRKFLMDLKAEPRTLIFYESVRRIKESLKDLFEIFGNRKVTVARELTKKFETFERGFLKEILSRLDLKNLKGEFVLVVQGFKEEEIHVSSLDESTLVQEVEETMKNHNLSKKEAVKWVAEMKGLSRKYVYRLTHSKQGDAA